MVTDLSSTQGAPTDIAFGTVEPWSLTSSTQVSSQGVLLNSTPQEPPNKERCLQGVNSSYFGDRFKRAKNDLEF